MPDRIASYGAIDRRETSEWTLRRRGFSSDGDDEPIILRSYSTTYEPGFQDGIFDPDKPSYRTLFWYLDDRGGRLKITLEIEGEDY